MATLLDIGQHLVAIQQVYVIDSGLGIGPNGSF
jgi:hypothetical protein